MGAFSVLVGMSAGGERQLRVLGERGAQPLAGKLVAVAEQAREGDLAGDALFEGPHAGGHRAGLGVPVEPLHGMKENGTP